MANGRLLPRLLPVLGALLSVPLAVPAHASTNLLKGYIGASVGYASLRAKDSNLFASSPNSLGSFDRSDAAYQIIAGVRALDLLGAEIDYFHLGSGSVSPSWSGPGSLSDAHVLQKGEAAFAVLYLPVPVIDIYVKAGVARLTTHLYASIGGSGCSPGLPLPPCPVISANGAINTTETGFAAGAGVQWKFGAWALRGEYERFAALGEHPSLVSVGVTWSFL
jgi:opacity protein-like surface antigen